MNTESMNTLKQIRVLISELQFEFHKPDTSEAEKVLLEDVLNVLNRLEDEIIHSILQEMVDSINSTNIELKELIDKMQQSSEKIANFSKKVKKISDIIEVLGEITTKAMSVGIL